MKPLGGGLSCAGGARGGWGGRGKGGGRDVRRTLLRKAGKRIGRKAVQSDAVGAKVCVESLHVLCVYRDHVFNPEAIDK